MTDKQIIIDGVDVSDCIYYEDGKCFNNEICQCSCNKVAVCYYKEYKRKEQECKVFALDAKIADNHLQNRIKMCDALGEKLKEKEQECERLDIEAQNLFTEKTNLEIELNELKAYIKEDLAPHAKLYKQTLTEIREITDIINDRTMVASYICDHLDKILQRNKEKLC